jgi:hypothetical protein
MKYRKVIGAGNTATVYKYFYIILVYIQIIILFLCILNCLYKIKSFQKEKIVVSNRE